ncbi:aminotransferase class V-fold PLP-dependent enzyme [Pseudooceanicola sp. GBMRC 2024]|uniref:Aminotransferase class V-fold PLP-dependent enzyme n=1 Tax=Pseudooceanicola albus TaxID=2692189 RepID=A0A6L7G2S3_9RHOB|nr:aminotransferase class V-fold PLP-dependent enzyme [Pseudooceanicola albus]MXN17808.1 aminotransferase class V-fold PLP-dependent enzyme [Pseudooceanicola albus]
MTNTSTLAAPAIDAEALLPEVLAFRRRFPIFQSKVHLANNAMAAVSDSLEAAHRQFLEDRLAHGASWEVAQVQHDRLKAQFATLIGAKPSEIALCYGATQALGVFASCFDYRTRPGIVFDDYSFPSVAQLWHAQTRRGAKVTRVAPGADGLLLPEHFVPAVDETTAFVSSAHVCYKNGHRLDVAGTAKVAHDAGALFVLDDYQGCGSRLMDVRAQGVDVLVAGTVKYLLGSPGVTLMYVKEELHDQLHPTLTGWFGQQDPHAMRIDAHVEAPDASKFQCGTPALGPIYDSVAGLDLLLSVGIDKVSAWMDHLTARLIARLDEEGFLPATPRDPARRGPQVGIRAKDGAAAVAALAKRGITSTQRDNNVRTAWHFYNTPDDIEALIAALHDIRPLMA